jgi:hypothetical protein
MATALAKKRNGITFLLKQKNIIFFLMPYLTIRLL